MDIGYACITYAVPGLEYRTCLLKNATAPHLERLICHNLDALEQAVRYDARNGIVLFRITSEIIPLASHPEFDFDWEGRFAVSLARLGRLIRDYNIRVSMHPGQYTVLNTPDPVLLQKSIADIAYHVRFLDSLGVDTACKVILHIGGAYGDKLSALHRFARAWMGLDVSARRRIVIENDERLFNIEEVLNIGLRLGIPVVFDALHHRLNLPPGNTTDGEWIRRCGETWQEHDGRQKIHYSQQSSSSRAGAHSSTIHLGRFIEYLDMISRPDVDVMLETKDKNISALKCILGLRQDVPASILEEEWARYGYLVMSRSHKAYEHMRSLMCTPGNVGPAAFYGVIDDVLQQCDPSAEVDAARHIWGCFSSHASNGESQRFLYWLQEYQDGKRDISSLKSFLHRLAQKYQIECLLKSYYFYY